MQDADLASLQLPFSLKADSFINLLVGSFPTRVIFLTALALFLCSIIDSRLVNALSDPFLPNARWLLNPKADTALEQRLALLMFTGVFGIGFAYTFIVL